MSLRHGLLGIINYTPLTGYELSKVFKVSLSFFWQAQPSQIYRELSAMEKLDWLSSQQVVQVGKPNKKIYQITETGKLELQRWMSDANEDIHNSLHVRNPFLMRIFFGSEMETDKAIDQIRRFRTSCIEKMEQMNAAYESVAEYGAMFGSEKSMQFWYISALFGDEFYNAGLIWADKALAFLEEQSDKRSSAQRIAEKRPK